MTSAEDRRLVVSEFDRALFPGESPTLQTAWLGIYQVLWWFVDPPELKQIHEIRETYGAMSADVQAAFDLVERHVGAATGRGPLHLREANDMRMPTWIARSRTAESYIADELGVDRDDLPPLFDRMMGMPRWEGFKQRNNPLGNGLRMLVAEVLERWGSPRFEYPEEAKAGLWFPGIKLPGRSISPSIDVAITGEGFPKALVSCKWSIRHDRISDPTNECTEYKSAAIRRQWMHLRYFVVTNELNSQRLDKILDQSCVDGLVHVHLELAQMIGGTSPLMQEAIRSGRLLDLADWVKDTHTWD